MKYQGIDEEHWLYVINISSYDLILGTPFIWQHQICIGLNPARVVIGSDKSLPITQGLETRPLVHSIDAENDEIARVRKELEELAAPLCKSMEETGLPPLRAINHKIPLIDEDKVYPWRPSRCPEVFREQWAEKRAAYINTGRWEVTTATNTMPMLLIPKPKKDKPELRTVFDLRARNANTVKMTSPLPDIEGILRRAAKKPFRSMLDLKAAYEQIRVKPEHVPRTAVTTPDGNIVSNVVQQGDCNAPATYQALMNHLFSNYIGVFMDVYLDDILIYSDTLEEHVEHVKIVLSILHREKLYLSPDKLQFLIDQLEILGHIVDSEGIRMDPHKVDTVLAWKTPTNRDLLRGFIGSVGYLADDIPSVRVPMGVLTAITGDAVPFRWTYTEQRAFEDVKRLVHDAREFRRVPLSYAKDSPPIWMVTDGCATGVAGVVSQGADWKDTKVAAFYSAKLNPTQQNYPVHEIEMLAGVETMCRHRDILQGAPFTWITDHKGLEHFFTQKELSGRQARWLEKIGTFDFKIQYVPGVENVLADSLSRMYSNDAPGTVRARSEYTYHDVVTNDAPVRVHTGPMPVFTALEALALSPQASRISDASPVARRTRGALRAAEAAANPAPASPTPVVAIPAIVDPPAGSQSEPTRPNAADVVDPPAKRRARKVVEPAESGRPETGAEFAKRMAGHFTLLGPREAREGEHAELANVSTQGNPEIIETHLDDDYIPLPDASLVEVVESSTGSQGINFLDALKGLYKDDPMFHSILQKPDEYTNFRVKDGLLYLLDDGRTLLCIPKGNIGPRSAREIVISEAHSILAHLGAAKTIAYLRDHVYWKDLTNHVKTFCETCHTCRMNKPDNQRPYGLLNPLPISSYPWEAIGVDFVGPLPESSNRDGTFDSITVTIDLLTSMVHLVPSRTNYTAKEVAELMFESVYKLHGLPRRIVSDRDVLFTSTFWQRLNELIGPELKMSSAYHPETDGATERANRTLVQMLRELVNNRQTDWAFKLPAIEFALNSARSDSTGFSPFFLNHGRMPRAMVWNSAPQSEFPAVRNFALTRKLAIISAHDSIIAARVKQVRDANKKRRMAPFAKDDLVYLSTKNISFPKGLARKLIPRYIGPFKVLEDFGNQSFRLQLSDSLKQRGVHDVFHASLLRVHLPNDDRLFPGRSDEQVIASSEDNSEWAIERILGHAKSGRDALFWVQWRAGDKTFVPWKDISELPAVQVYLDLQNVPNIDALPVGLEQLSRASDPQVALS